MNINYKIREYKDPVDREDLDELKNILKWFIYGYKYFYLKYAETNDEEAKNLAKSAERIISYFAEHMLSPWELEQFELIESKDTVNDDIIKLNRLFADTKKLSCTYSPMTKEELKSYMQFFLESEDDFSYSEELSDYAKLMLAAGAVNQHGKTIENISGRKIDFITDTPIDPDEIDRDYHRRRYDIIYDVLIEDKRRPILQRSLKYITDYQYMVNNELMNSEYYCVDDYRGSRVLKARL